MSALATQLPVRRPELRITPLGENGQYVVKDPRSGEFFHLGPQEHFLLEQLDGEQSGEAIRTAFTDHFGEPLSDEDLDGFIELARAQGFLQPETQTSSAQDSAPRNGCGPASPLPPAPPEAPVARRRQSLLYWRKSFFDPDRLFNWLEPKIRFFWTRGFLIFSAGCILLAVFLIWANGHQVASSFAQALRWETVLWVWLTLFTVTILHEFAHGLTCKHYGGEVHEIGFLMIFFLPGFYCNVSDAWLFKEKSKRLWVTFAGGYFELFLWALAVLVWRLTMPDSLLNYLAFVVLASCGVRILFNLNPLIKLDGYYLLSDWVGVPNLQQRGQGHFKAHLRALLWGAPRPAGEPRGRLLFRYGLASWLYSVVFLSFMLWLMLGFFGANWGWAGVGLVALLGHLTLRGLFRGFTAGEVANMISKRCKRTAVWLLILGGVAAALCFVEIEDRASGTFHVRPLARVELRAPVAGFVKEVYADEGDRVSPGALVARLEVPDLTSRLAQKQAEVRESQARLRLLEIGARPEEVAEQRQRVKRAREWRDLAQADLTRTRRALSELLERLDRQAAAARAERDVAQDAYQRARTLSSGRILSDQEYREAEGKHLASQARLAEAEAGRRSVEEKGTLEAEAELARRTKELADAEASLRLLEAGSRPEDIEAERARLARLREEAGYLEQLQGKLQLYCSVGGLVTTPRVREKVGQYLREGELLCTVEDPAGLEAEISLTEKDMTHVQAGQAVALKARTLPFEELTGKVDRVAPVAVRGDAQSQVTVYCRLDRAPPELRPGMTGYARVYTSQRAIGAILVDRILGFVRTEFWW
ncbi:MAG: HlyD family efflux transporter periplasmic adaptor subunit [Gemmataceae bacterium]|nr:HlyD family efflux transporter periplasmic adaptor subunit [Gemmataceae bacterium]